MSIAIVVVLLFIAAVRRRRLRNFDRRSSLARHLPEVVDLLVAGLHAGHPPARSMSFLAVAAPIPVRPVFSAAEDALLRGEQFTRILRSLPDHLGSAYRPLCEILVAGERLGTPSDSLVHQLSSDARTTRRLLAEADARRLPVRLAVPLVCCTLPSFVVLVIVPVIAGALSHMHINP